MSDNYPSARGNVDGGHGEEWSSSRQKEKYVPRSRKESKHVEFLGL